MPSLIYLQPMPFPSAQTHTFQIARTVAALGERVEVQLVVGHLSVEPGQLAEAVARVYGVQFGPGVRVMAVSPRWLRGPWFPWALRPILAAAPADAVFYTRSFPIARRLLRFRWLHRRRVFLETHKKAGYLKEDPVPGSRYHEIRRRFEATNESAGTIAAVYAAVDGLFFLHRHSLVEVRRRQAVRATEHLWYGWRTGSWGGRDGSVRTADRAGIVHCGSLAEHKLFVLLVDALERTTTDVRVAVYGGEPDRVAWLERAIAGRPVADRLQFHGWRDQPVLAADLRRFRHGLALQEGMKAIDYLENGVTPIVPDLPSYRDELDERHAIFFRPDDPDSLAAVLDSSGGRTADWAAVRDLAERYSMERRADRIVAMLDR